MRAFSPLFLLFFIFLHQSPSQAQFEVCGEGFNGWETPCCLDPNSGWRFGYCNTTQGVFVDLCLDFFFGRCRSCTTEYSCPDNNVPDGVTDCFVEQINRARQTGRSQAKYDHARRNMHLSDLALGHACYWFPDDPLGLPGDFIADRELLVRSDLPFWLDREFSNAGVCPEVKTYTELCYFGTCEGIYNWIMSDPARVDVVQSGIFSGSTQTSFMGVGTYHTTDALGPMAVIIIWVNTGTHPEQVGSSDCSGNVGPLA